MTATALKDQQLLMARYLRDPGRHPAPAGVESRRLKIYEDLIYNNIEGFISGGFPVLRSLYRDADWHSLVRLFIDQHRCHTPYFLEISQEFLRFLMEVHQPRVVDPAFLAELAHYEWVELALDVSQDEVPEGGAVTILLEAVPLLSPLAWPLQYRFPVHRIGPSFRPGEEEAQPTFLVVYRNRDDQVGFMELNAVTARLLELIGQGGELDIRSLLAQLAAELGMAKDAILAPGVEQVAQLVDADVIILNSHH